MAEHEHADVKPGGQAKAVLAVLAVIAIIIPVVLGVVLVHGSLPLPTAPNNTGTGSGTPNTVYLPLGAGGPQQNNFSPSSLTVASGTTITFVDQDTDAPHNIYFTLIPAGASQPATSPTLTNGDTYTVTLTTPGTYHFECQFHPGWMQATIVVTG
jgi:plastocyanin